MPPSGSLVWILRFPTNSAFQWPLPQCYLHWWQSAQISSVQRNSAPETVTPGSEIVLFWSMDIDRLTCEINVKRCEIMHNNGTTKTHLISFPIDPDFPKLGNLQRSGSTHLSSETPSDPLRADWVSPVPQLVACQNLTNWDCTTASAVDGP